MKQWGQHHQKLNWWSHDHFTPSHQILEKSAKKLKIVQQNKQIWLWPYKGRTKEGSTTKIWSGGQLTISNLHAKFPKNLPIKKLILYNKISNLTFDPIKVGTMRAAPPKSKLLVTWPFQTITPNFRKFCQKLNALRLNKQIWPLTL